jgi:hypothetical protein
MDLKGTSAFDDSPIQYDAAVALLPNLTRAAHAALTASLFVARASCSSSRAAVWAEWLVGFV